MFDERHFLISTIITSTSISAITKLNSVPIIYRLPRQYIDFMLNIQDEKWKKRSVFVFETKCFCATNKYVWTIRGYLLRLLDEYIRVATFLLLIFFKKISWWCDWVRLIKRTNTFSNDDGGLCCSDSATVVSMMQTSADLFCSNVTSFELLNIISIKFFMASVRWKLFLEEQHFVSSTPLHFHRILWDFSVRVYNVKTEVYADFQLSNFHSQV